MNDITIKLNGKSIKLSGKDSNQALAHKLAQVALAEINAPSDTWADYRLHLEWWRDIYQTKLEAAQDWWSPELVITRRLEIDQRYSGQVGRKRLRIEERIWTLRKLIAEEVLAAIEELMR